MVTDIDTSRQKTAFAARLFATASARRTWLCAGIDPDPRAIPDHLPRTPEGVYTFCREIIAATHDLVAAFKLNVAFFEALGPDGWALLHRVRALIPAEVPVIVDAKRGDIGNTARAYARALFDGLEADSITVNPYLGADSLAPFMEYPGQHIFVLCKTSNEGAADLQELVVDGEPVYMHVARLALSLRGQTGVGLVVGATQPDALKRIRNLNDSTLLLLPGLGAQGGDARLALQAGANSAGDNALLSASREILFASPNLDFAHATRDAAERLAVACWRESSPHATD